MHSNDDDQFLAPDFQSSSSPADVELRLPPRLRLLRLLLLISCTRNVMRACLRLRVCVCAGEEAVEAEEAGGGSK